MEDNAGLGEPSVRGVPPSAHILLAIIQLLGQLTARKHDLVEHPGRQEGTQRTWYT